MEKWYLAPGKCKGIPGKKKEQHFYDHRGVEDEFHFVSRGVWYLEKKKTSGKEHISDLDTLCLHSMMSLERWQDTIGQYSGDMGLCLSPWGMGLPGVTEDFHFGIIYGKCMEYTGQKTISFIHFRTGLFLSWDHQCYCCCPIYCKPVYLLYSNICVFEQGMAHLLPAYC